MPRLLGCRTAAALQMVACLQLSWKRAIDALHLVAASGGCGGCMSSGTRMPSTGRRAPLIDACKAAAAVMSWLHDDAPLFVRRSLLHSTCPRPPLRLCPASHSRPGVRWLTPLSCFAALRGPAPSWCARVCAEAALRPASAAVRLPACRRPAPPPPSSTLADSSSPPRRTTSSAALLRHLRVSHRGDGRQRGRLQQRGRPQPWWWWRRRSRAAAAAPAAAAI